MCVALEYNFYEELKLSTLDKKLTADDILSAADRYITSIRKTYNNVSDDVRVTLNAKLALEAEMRAFASDKAAQKRHREDLWEKHTAQLKRLAAIMKGGAGEETPAVLRARLTRLAGHFDLELGVVKKVFEEAGYTVLANQRTSVDKLFTEEAALRDIAKALEKIRATLQMEQSKPGAVRYVPDQMETVRTLYDYLAVQRAEGSAAEFGDPKRTSTEQLCRMFSELLTQSNRTDNHEPFMSFKNLESIAACRVFNSDENRLRYNRTVKFAPVMDTLTFIGTLPEAVKSDRSFAESVIEQIQRYFPDEDAAIAIYNKYVKLPPELAYEKERVEIRTMCRCGRVNVHAELAQAQKARCVNCGESLYRPCPSCGALGSNMLEYCVCGYYIPDFVTYKNHKSLCENAVQRKNLEEARRELLFVQGCRPQNEDISALEQAVQNLETQMASRLSAISIAIDEGRLKEAADKLAELQRQYPAMDLQRYSQRLADARAAVQKTLDRADNDYSKIRRLSTMSAKVEACLRILEYAPSYHPVLALLHSPELRPLKPLNLRAMENHNERCVYLTWNPNPGDLFITYRVVRRENSVPTGPNDGVVTASGLKTVNLMDKDLTPGVEYYYAVFAERMNVCSEAAYCSGPVFLTPGLCRENVSYAWDGAACTLCWKDVPGSCGVLVERSTGGGSAFIELHKGARTSFTDKNLMKGMRYRYVLSTVWKTHGGDEKISCDVVEVEVHAVTRPAPLNAERVSTAPDGLCKIRWNTSPDTTGPVNLMALYTAKGVQENQEYDAAFVSALGKTCMELDASAGEATFSIGSNKCAVVALFCPYGGKMVAGRPLLLSTLKPLQVNWKKLRVEIPLVYQFPYAVIVPCVNLPSAIKEVQVRIRNAAGERAEKTEAVKGSSALNVIVNCQKSLEGEAEVQVLGKTAGGFVTQPASQMVTIARKTEIRYWLTWTRSVIGRRVSKLTAEGSANGFHTCKALYLCVSQNGFFGEEMRYYNKEKMTQIARIEPDAYGRFKVEITAQELEAVSREGRLELLPRLEDVNRFHIICETPQERQWPH